MALIRYNIFLVITFVRLEEFRGHSNRIFSQMRRAAATDSLLARLHSGESSTISSQPTTEEEEEEAISPLGCVIASRLCGTPFDNPCKEREGLM